MKSGFSCAETVCVMFGCLLALALLTTPLAAMAPDGLAGRVPSLFVLCMVAWIAWKDIFTLTIPDGPLVAIALVGAAIRLAAADGQAGTEALATGLDGLLCGGALLAIREMFFRQRGFDGLGFGDVKLAAAVAILVGAVTFFWALFLASVAGLIFVGAAAIVKPSRTFDRLPFGALLAPLCWCVWVARW